MGHIKAYAAWRAASRPQPGNPPRSPLTMAAFASSRSATHAAVGASQSVTTCTASSRRCQYQACRWSMAAAAGSGPPASRSRLGPLLYRTLQLGRAGGGAWRNLRRPAGEKQAGLRAEGVVVRVDLLGYASADRAGRRRRRFQREDEVCLQPEEVRGHVEVVHEREMTRWGELPRGVQGEGRGLGEGA